MKNSITLMEVKTFTCAQTGYHTYIQAYLPLSLSKLEGKGYWEIEYTSKQNSIRNLISRAHVVFMNDLINLISRAHVVFMNDLSDNTNAFEHSLRRIIIVLHMENEAVTNLCVKLVELKKLLSQHCISQ